MGKEILARPPCLLARRAAHEQADAAIGDVVGDDQRAMADEKPARMLVAAHHPAVERRQTFGEELPEIPPVLVEFRDHSLDQAAASALMPSATNCTASAARITPRSRVRIERPVAPSRPSMRSARMKTR